MTVTTVFSKLLLKKNYEVFCLNTNSRMLRERERERRRVGRSKGEGEKEGGGKREKEREGEQRGVKVGAELAHSLTYCSDLALFYTHANLASKQQSVPLQGRRGLSP